MVYVFEDENRWCKFRQLMLLLAGLTVMLAGLAVVALIYAPAATMTTVLSTATLVGVGTTGGGLLTYQRMKRMRAANELPAEQNTAPDPGEADGNHSEPQDGTDG
jgi:hypothetical protein